MTTTSTERVRAYRAANPEHCRKTERERQRRYRLRKLGVTPEQYDVLMAECDSACSICRTPFTDAVPPCTDHCHDTGAVRGLLCHPCNLGIGNLKDDPDLVRAALAYLERTVTTTKRG